MSIKRSKPLGIYRSTRCAIGAILAFSYPVTSSELAGQVTIEKKVIKKTVSAAVYDLRGISVSDSAPNPHTSNEFEKIAVWLDSPGVSPPSPITAKLEQRNKRFEPDLLVIPVRSTVEFPNLDPIFHNIFSLSRTQSFDLGYYSEGQSRKITFARTGIVQVYCHVHPDMHAVIVVTSTPWFGKPESDGRFSWANIPPGTYKLFIWQRSIGLIHKTVTVPQTGAAHVTIALPDDSDN